MAKRTTTPKSHTSKRTPTPTLVPLGRDDILGRDDFTHVDVQVPEWGGIVRLRGLSASEGADVAKAVREDTGDVLQRIVSVVQLLAIDGKGNRLFNQKGDVEALAEKNLTAFMRLQGPAMELIGLGSPALTLELVEEVLSEVDADEAIVEITMARLRERVGEGSAKNS